MANAKKCDICGNFYVQTKQISDGVNIDPISQCKYRQNIVVIGFGSNETAWYDICPDCVLWLRSEIGKRKPIEEVAPPEEDTEKEENSDGGNEDADVAID